MIHTVYLPPMLSAFTQAEALLGNKLHDLQYNLQRLRTRGMTTYQTTFRQEFWHPLSNYWELENIFSMTE